MHLSNVAVNAAVVEMHHSSSWFAADHHLGIVALAAILCVMASAATILLFHRAQVDESRGWFAWLGLAAVAGGCGIWATHFVAMLAYQPGIRAKFDLAPTVLSLVVAVAFTGLGLGVALRKRSADVGFAGGAIVGCGIAMMHYIGMTAMHIAGHLSWNLPVVALSVGVGTLLSATAFSIGVTRRNTSRLAMSTLLLTFSILILHFMGMMAVSIEPDPAQTAEGSLSRNTLSIVVATVTAVLIGISLLAAIADRRARIQIRRQQLMLDTALENMRQGLCMFEPDGRMRLYNDRYLKMFNLSPAMVEGKTLLDLLRAMKEAGHFRDDPEETFSDVVLNIQEGRSGNRIIETVDGRSIRVTDQPMSNGGWVATFEDITEWRKNQAQISHMAHHDGLTDLPNRTLFREQLALALRRTAREGSVAVHCLDLDHFKYVNDTLGHPAGDELLRQVAQRLQSTVRETDTVARLGGDEFAVVQAESNLTIAEATALAGRIVETLSAPYEVKGHQVIIGASVGIAVGPDDGNDPDQLLRNADMALYRAKADGRGTYRFFEAGMDARAQARRMLELDLRAALLRNEFEVWYQPIYDLEAARIICFEALVRWHHPERGILAPEHFIRLAEETGLIVPIGEWVLRRACADAAGWSQDVAVAVNLSPAQFRNRNLVPSILQAIADSGLAPQRLELEITEAVLLQDNELTLASLHQLRKHGVRIAMDDFGTGYSSLSYLRSFPFDKIKIDRSFVRELSERGDCMAIVRAVAGLGKSLGIATTAEGVETDEQLSLLQEEGCSQVQGYLFNAPQPATEVERMLSSAARRRSA